jgi:hypothetical protein
MTLVLLYFLVVGLRFKFFHIVCFNFYVFQKSFISDSFHAHDISMQVNNNFKVGKSLMKKKGLKIGHCDQYY